MLTQLTNSTFNNARPRETHSLWTRHFSSSTYDHKMNMISVEYVIDFQSFYGLSDDFLSWRMRSPVWIHCCKQPNLDFCISQSSVETVIRWGGLKYSCLRQVSSWCCLPKIIKIGQCFTELFKKLKWHVFFTETRCIFWKIRTYSMVFWRTPLSSIKYKQVFHCSKNRMFRNACKLERVSVSLGI